VVISVPVGRLGPRTKIRATYELIFTKISPPHTHCREYKHDRYRRLRKHNNSVKRSNGESFLREQTNRARDVIITRRMFILCTRRAPNVYRLARPEGQVYVRKSRARGRFD